MTNHFDTVAQDWDRNQVHIKRTKAIAAAIKEMIKPDKKSVALEFGAGTGLLSFALKNNFSHITLMDSSAEMIKATMEKVVYSGNKHLVPLFFDLEKKNYKETKFDVIFSQMALHHVQDIEKIIISFKKLLNKGGKLALADLYTEDGTFHDFLFEGHRGFDPLFLIALLRKNGFKNTLHKKVFTIKKDIGEATIKQYPVFLITAEKK
jgi:ubiquinone/menaquinone biosynthesis C-methylase UbiE